MIGYLLEKKYLRHWTMLGRLQFHIVTALDLGNVPSVFESCGQSRPRVIANFVYKYKLRAIDATLNTLLKSTLYRNTLNYLSKTFFVLGVDSTQLFRYIC